MGNPSQTTCIKITAEGLTTEIAHRQYDEETADRIYSGAALMKPERWEHNRYKLTMTMKDLFEPDDDINRVATVMFRRLRTSHCTSCSDIICGTVYLVNENEHYTIYFTMDDYVHVARQALSDVW